MDMPKLKTHSGTKDRVNITKTGKVKFRRAGGNHFLEGKSKSRKRTYAGMQNITGKIAKTIKKRLGA
jgi:large subunit ribosomal protein L35